MTDQDRPPEQRNALILERLRAAFGEERQGEFSDLDGLGMLSTFLRPVPQADDGEAERALSRHDLAELRRQRRAQRRSAARETDELALITESTPPTPGAYATLIDEIPRLREHFADWLASVDADIEPSSTSLEELYALREKTEYRLRLLNTLVAETQRDLDQLIVAIRAAETIRDDAPAV